MTIQNFMFEPDIETCTQQPSLSPILTLYTSKDIDNHPRQAAVVWCSKIGLSTWRKQLSGCTNEDNKNNIQRMSYGSVGSSWRMSGRVWFLSKIMLKHIFFINCKCDRKQKWFLQGICAETMLDKLLMRGGFNVLSIIMNTEINGDTKDSPSKSSSSKSISSSSSSSDPSIIVAAAFWAKAGTFTYNKIFNNYFNKTQISKYKATAPQPHREKRDNEKSMKRNFVQEYKIQTSLAKKERKKKRKKKERQW